MHHVPAWAPAEGVRPLLDQDQTRTAEKAGENRREVRTPLFRPSLDRVYGCLRGTCIINPSRVSQLSGKSTSKITGP